MLNLVVYGWRMYVSRAYHEFDADRHNGGFHTVKSKNV